MARILLIEDDDTTGGDRKSAADKLRMAKLLGAAKTLAKPFSNEALIAAINELLPGNG
jgi:DNA-binding response OmpR family regulator